MSSRLLVLLVLLIDSIESRLQLKLITDHPIAFESIDFQLLSSSNDTIIDHHLSLYNDANEMLIERYALSNITSSLITFPCHCFLIGNINYSIRLDSNITLLTFFVNHPSSPIQLSMPNSSRPSRDVSVNITNAGRCTTIDVRLILRVQHPIVGSMQRWIELATLQFAINTTTYRWSCGLFAESNAIYETQLISANTVISTSNQMTVINDDASSYRLTMRSDSIYPNCDRDLLIAIDRRCAIAHDRLRLFAVTAQQLVYIGERRITAEPTTIVAFSCALFDIIYPTFCFELVSVLPQTSVVMHRVQQCVATEPPSHATIDGAWSPWSAWSKCADPPSRCDHRRRFRTCTDPSPKHGGSFCTGRAIQMDKCNGSYPCATTTLTNETTTTTRRPLLASVEQCACGCRLVHNEGALVIESGRCTNVSIWLIDPLRSQSSTRRLHLHVIDDRLTMDDRLIIYNSRNRMIYDSQQSPSKKDVDYSIDDDIEGNGAAAAIIYYPSSSNWIASENWHNAIVEYRWNIDDEDIDRNTTLASSSAAWKWWSSTASSRHLLTMIALLSPAALLLVVPPFIFIFIIQRRLRHQQQQLHRPAPIVVREEEREGLITADDIMNASHQTQSTRLSAQSSQLHTVTTVDPIIQTIGRRSIGVQLSTISLAARGLSVQSTPSLPHHTRSSFQQHRYSPRSTNRRCAPPFDDSTLSLGGTASEQDFEYDYYEPAAVPGSYLLPTPANSFFTSQIDIDQIIGDNSMLMMDDDASSSANQRTMVAKKCYSVSTQIDDDK